MTRWTTDELETIGGAEEVQIAAARSDGKLRQPVTVWIVRHGDTLYVRSAVKGPNASWFQGVRETHQGRIWGGGIEKDVTLAEANHKSDDEIDAVYRAKYRTYSGRILNSVLTPEARATTMNLVPRSMRS